MTNSEWQDKLDQRDLELYTVRDEYSECTVTKNRALYILRVIAGLVPDDPRSEGDPRAVAENWLKGYGLLDGQLLISFGETKDARCSVCSSAGMIGDQICYKCGGTGKE